MISILLASYNGEEYIAEQIESLLGQTVQDFRLIIRDDKSTDATWSIIKKYALKYPDRVFVSQNEINSGGAKHNFINMMVANKDDYVMLCDQDDVWLPEKIGITLEKMKETEGRVGASTPVLIHTDLKVVDRKLKLVFPSFRVAMNANYGKTLLRNQIIQNTLTGCTAMYNRALANLLIKTPEYIIMHDWWLILVASAFGRVEALSDVQTVLYRQHGNNEIGAKDVRALKYKANLLFNYQAVKRAINETYRQAESLLSLYGDMLSADARRLLLAYCDVPKHLFKPVRWLRICRLGTFKNGVARKIAYFLFL